MAKKVIRLTESEFNRLVRQAVKRERKNIQEQNYLNPEAMETGDAIVTMVVTVLGLLGVAGYGYIKSMIEDLRNEGKEDEASEMETALENYGDQEGGMEDSEEY